MYTYDTVAIEKWLYIASIAIHVVRIEQHSSTDCGLLGGNFSRGFFSRNFSGGFYSGKSGGGLCRGSCGL